MGLDFTIKHASDFRTDEKGRNCHTVTTLVTLYKINNFVDILNWQLEYGLSPCADYEFDGNTLYEIANKLDNVEEKEYILKELKEAGVENSNEEYYIINASW
jgi:hypothetical protein